jgi:hypothetical protein
MTVRSRSLDRAAAERRLRKRRGRVSEAFGAGVLIAKGYRILGRRVRTRQARSTLLPCAESALPSWRLSNG